ncbi:MAG: tyrosine-type recombinase/integrase [Thermodesulfobacteriota bacterium]
MDRPHIGVDLERKTVTVFHSKNGERRAIPLNKAVMGLLNRKKKVRSLKTDHVFYTTNHTPYHPCNLRRDFVKAVKKAGLDDFHFHDLRAVHSPQGWCRPGSTFTRSANFLDTRTSG